VEQQLSRIVLTEVDEEYLLNNYPSLIYDKKRNLIYGRITLNHKFKDFRAISGESYNIEFPLMTQGYYLLPDNRINPMPLFMRKRDYILPRVKDVDNKILKIAKRKKINPQDMHLINNEYLCLIHKTKEKGRYPEGYKLKEFLHHIEEHLYWVTYFDRYGEKPWPDEPHN
jgi:hypothetical protein